MCASNAETEATYLGANFAAPAGDMNGDGLMDVALIVAKADPLGRKDAGLVSIIFGRRSHGCVSAGVPGERGFVVQGAFAFNYLGVADSAGDVNGDGLDDIIVGARQAGLSSTGPTGAAYVIFGRKKMADIDLRAFEQGIAGDKGFVIREPPRRDAGGAVAGVGDTNGDGLSDVAVNAWNDHVYVVFGKKDGSMVDLAAFDAGDPQGRGFRIDRPEPYWPTETPYFAPVAAAGDANGDGFADVALGIPRDPARGGVRIVFTVPGEAIIDARGRGFLGVDIIGPPGTGSSLDGGQDVNADGLDDVVFGTGESGRTGVAVVYGSRAPRRVDLKLLRQDGSWWQSNSGAHALGFSVAFVGDLDNDGFADVVATGPTEWGAAAYVFWGSDVPTTLATDERPPRRVASGVGPPVIAGAVAGVGDVDGDRTPDVMTCLVWERSCSLISGTHLVEMAR